MIIFKSEKEIEKIKAASRYAMETLRHVSASIKAGIDTMALESVCQEKIRKIPKARPAFKGYNGFPFCLCVSVNEEVVHGMPGDRILEEGDIVSLDFGVLYDGYYGDVAMTYGVGKISAAAQRLMDVTEGSLYRGIANMEEGNRLHDVSYAVQRHVEDAGFSVVRDFVGHGIGSSLHEDPQLPNFGVKGTGARLRKGMVFAIEPMVNMGRSEVVIRENGWTAVTEDGSLSAHFEHTVAIRENGTEILSRI